VQGSERWLTYSCIFHVNEHFVGADLVKDDGCQLKVGLGRVDHQCNCFDVCFFIFGGLRSELDMLRC
jgi:hypothetical protein